MSGLMKARTSRRWSLFVRGQPLDQGPNPDVDLVPDAAHRLDVLAGGIFEIPVLVALARVDRTRIATAHGDDHVRLTHESVGEGFRNLPADVEADLFHCLDHAGVESARRLAAGRAHADSARPPFVEKRCRHLAASRVVDAHEQNLGDVFAHAMPRPYPQTTVGSESIPCRREARSRSSAASWSWRTAGRRSGGQS